MYYLKCVMHPNIPDNLTCELDSELAVLTHSEHAARASHTPSCALEIQLSRERTSSRLSRLGTNWLHEGPPPPIVRCASMLSFELQTACIYA